MHTIFQKFDKIITIEDGCLQGGFGSSILEFMANNDYQAKVKLGIPDEFIHHGTQQELWAHCGFDKDGIVKTIKHMLNLAISEIENAVNQ